MRQMRERVFREAEEKGEFAQHHTYFKRKQHPRNYPVHFPLHLILSFIYPSSRSIHEFFFRPKGIILLPERNIPGNQSEPTVIDPPNIDIFCNWQNRQVARYMKKTFEI